MIAALYVDPRGSYASLSGVQVWTEASAQQTLEGGGVYRDARGYDGPYAVVAHPPCSAWCRLAPINQKRWGALVGDDDGCFVAAMWAVNRWGGVLEHPAGSRAWSLNCLSRPVRGDGDGGGWTSCERTLRGWVCEVAQSAYGHPAQKLTWLYYVGCRPPTPMLRDRPRGRALVSHCANHTSASDERPRIAGRAAAASPPAFRDALLALARGAS